MTDRMNETRRTHYCGVLTAKEEGQTVTVCGFAQKQRDLGNLIFIDLRDRTGMVQLAFNDRTDRAVFEKAGEVRSEFVADGNRVRSHGVKASTPNWRPVRSRFW